MKNERRSRMWDTISGTASGKAATSLFSVAVLLAGGAVAARGQSAYDGFNTYATDDAGNVAEVDVVVAQPDGKILLGGDFTRIAPIIGQTATRKHIARLNSDGTVDFSFNPNANNDVYSITVQADGKILIGGSFTSVGGQPRNRIARVDPNTGSPDAFNPNANGSVDSIAVQADGKVLAGGSFTSIGGQPRNRIARLDRLTGLADSFDPNASDFVESIAVQADSKILVGGNFTQIGGLLRNCIARLDPTTGLPDSFAPNTDNFGFVFSIAFQADGRILVGGRFTTIGGQPRNRIARLDPLTGLPDSFNPNADGFVNSIAVQADGKILAGGEFGGIGGQERHAMARLDATTGMADSFNPNMNNTSGAEVYSVAVQPDGQVLAVGFFTSIGAQKRGSVARIDTDGRLDQTLDLNIDQSFPQTDYVIATAVQPDGKILIGGAFSKVLGAERYNIARLNSDGTLDNAFDPNMNNPSAGYVHSIAVQPDAKILVGGTFTSIGGQPRNYLARLDATTGMADSFDPNPNGEVESIAVQADGKILAAGQFTRIAGMPRNHIARLDAVTALPDALDPNANDLVDSIAVQVDGKILAAGLFTHVGRQPRNRIARLDATTGLADSFNPSATGLDAEVYSIAVQPDGKILAGGHFTGIGGQARGNIARLDGTSGLADSFNPNANNTVRSIAMQADGKIWVGGDFTAIGGTTANRRNHIARLNSDGAPDASLHANANNTVYSIAIQPDGKILAAGLFTEIDQPRRLFARLTNETPALQELVVNRTTVTWTRGGSSPQLTRATFEYSTDNVNYTFLGNGIPSGSNWTLNGFRFPGSQNFYIRARGYYRCGSANASESVTESVRNAFLRPIL